MYVCGPTVYDETHVGHARTYIAFDIIRRYFEYLGLEVRMVINITDIDDKIINRAREEGVSWREISDRYTKRFFEDIRALYIKDAYAYPRATEHIDGIIELTQRLVELGYAYPAADGSVYMSVEKVEGYGELSKQRIEDLIAGARVEPSPYKRAPLDFALWKAWKPGEPWWPSPWGPGRPGWHIECVVMSTRYLGKVFDIHGGGQDLIFPHHENELAIAKALYGRGCFARYWLHTGLLTIRGEKMSKSLHNIIPVRELLKEYDAEAFRLYIASAHYRSQLDFAAERIAEYERLLDSLYAAHDYLKCLIRESPPSPGELVKAELGERERAILEELERSVREFKAAMNDDFNTPKALAALSRLARRISSWASSERLSPALLSKIYSEYVRMCQVFGVLNKTEPPVELEQLTRELIELLIEIRATLRSRRDWELADKIRSRLAELGIILSDARARTLWRWARPMSPRGG